MFITKNPNLKNFFTKNLYKKKKEFFFTGGGGGGGGG